MRDWVVKRRERTRHLIELGGLVVKAGLVNLADDDRATLYGAFLTVADKLRGDDRDHALGLWQRKGKRAFEAETETLGEGLGVTNSAVATTRIPLERNGQ